MIDDLKILYWGLKSMDFEIQNMEDSIERAKETYGYPQELIKESETTLKIMEEKRDQFWRMIDRWSRER